MKSVRTRAGFVALAGRPNVGKSTLLNALVDAEVAITSSKPETTRKAIRGILTREDFQIVFVDTPGIHRPRTLLGKRLNTITDEQLTQVDAIAFLSPANEKIGPGDLHIIKHLQQIASSRIKLVAIVTKTDLTTSDKLAERLMEISELAPWQEIVPVSSKLERNLGALEKVLVDLMPESEFLYDGEQLSDESWQSMVAEAVRQEALEQLEEELPHSLMTQVVERVGDTIYVNLYVERDSQKGIILGKGGARIKNIRHRATRIAREMLGKEIVLNLQVKVAKNWQQDTKLLAKFGF